MRRWLKLAGEIFWTPFAALEQGAAMIGKFIGGFFLFFCCLVLIIVLVLLAIFFPPVRKFLGNIFGDIFRTIFSL